MNPEHSHHSRYVWKDKDTVHCNYVEPLWGLLCERAVGHIGNHEHTVLWKEDLCGMSMNVQRTLPNGDKYYTVAFCVQPKGHEGVTPHSNF